VIRGELEGMGVASVELALALFNENSSSGAVFFLDGAVFSEGQ